MDEQLDKIIATIGNRLREGEDTLFSFQESLRLKTGHKCMFESVEFGSFNMSYLVQEMADRFAHLGIRYVSKYTPMYIVFESGVRLDFNSVAPRVFEISVHAGNRVRRFQKVDRRELCDHAECFLGEAVDKIGTLADKLVSGFREFGVSLPEESSEEYQNIMRLIEKHVKTLGGSGTGGTMGNPLRIFHMGAASPILYFLSSVAKQLPMSEALFLEEMMKYKRYFEKAQSFPYSTFNLMKGGGYVKLEGDEVSFGSKHMADFIGSLNMMGLDNKVLRG